MGHSLRGERIPRLVRAPADVAALWDFAHAWLGPVVRQLWQVTVQDAGRLPSGPAIVVANHLSYLDPIFLGLSLPRAGAFLAMEQVFRWPLIGFLADLAGAIPVPAPSGTVLDSARRILEAGHSVILYPEGMRTPQGVWGSVPLHTGAARLAVWTGLPIQPIALTGLEIVLPKGARWPAFGVPVTVRFGEPIAVGPLTAGLDTDAAVARLTDAIELAIADLLPDHLTSRRQRAA